jgi:hypothetical protein
MCRIVPIARQYCLYAGHPGRGSHAKLKGFLDVQGDVTLATCLCASEHWRRGSCTRTCGVSVDYPPATLARFFLPENESLWGAHDCGWARVTWDCPC